MKQSKKIYIKAVLNLLQQVKDRNEKKRLFEIACQQFNNL